MTIEWYQLKGSLLIRNLHTIVMYTVIDFCGNKGISQKKPILGSVLITQKAVSQNLQLSWTPSHAISFFELSVLI